MNSYAKFGGTARRHFSAICEKPMGGTMCPRPCAGWYLRYLKKKRYLSELLFATLKPISILNLNRLPLYSTSDLFSCLLRRKILLGDDKMYRY